MRHLPEHKEVIRTGPSGWTYPGATVIGQQSQSEPSWEYVGLNPDMPPNEGGFMDYWQALRRHKGLVLLFAIAGGLVGVLVTLPRAPVYQARTSIEVQDINPAIESLRQTPQQQLPYFALSDLQTQVKILQSESLAARTIGKLQLQTPAPALPVETALISLQHRLHIPQPQRSQSRAAMLKDAAKSVKVRSEGDVRIIEVFVDSTDSQMAADFANALADQFIDQNMDARWNMSQRTGDWLGRQLDAMKVKLEQSEVALQDYARQAGLLYTGGLSDEGKGNIEEDRLRQVQLALSAAVSDRVQKESRYQVAIATQPEALPDVANDSTLRAYRAQLTDLRRQLADLSVTYTPDFSNVKRLRGQIQSLEAEVATERKTVLDRIKNEYDEAMLREKKLSESYDNEAQAVSGDAGKAIQYNLLKREVDSNRQLYEAMLQRVKESGIAAALKASNIRVVDAALKPMFPYKPNIRMNSALGLFMGVIFGFGLAVIRERGDRSIRTPGDAPPWLNVPELGVIPSSHAWKRRLDRKKRFVLEGKSEAMAEAFRVVLASVIVSNQNGDSPKALVVTSSKPSEGKTTVATHLALRLSSIGKTVLLIDADLARPCLHDVFGIGNDNGLTDILQSPDFNEEVIRSAMHRVSSTLTVIPTGPHRSASADLLFASCMPELLEKWKNEFDMVVIDTPPMPQMSHARILGKLADGVILVIRAGRTTREAASAAIQRLSDDQTYVLGTVLNDWDYKTSPSDHYGRG
jgi:polysaccharide biosynthesis transport protein